MVPMIGLRPQTVELSMLAIKAAGFKLSKDSNMSVLLSENIHKIKMITIFNQETEELSWC